jgi:hypothetical protein
MPLRKFSEPSSAIENLNVTSMPLLQNFGPLHATVVNCTCKYVGPTGLTCGPTLILRNQAFPYKVLLCELNLLFIYSFSF